MEGGAGLIQSESPGLTHTRLQSHMTV